MMPKNIKDPRGSKIRKIAFRDVNVVSTIIKEKCQLIGCISASSGEGNTVSSGLLAKTLISYSASNVLFINFSVPKIESESGHLRSQGVTLAQFLRDPATEPTVHKLEKSGLYYVFPGEDLLVQDFLGRGNAQRVWGYFRKTFDYIIIDLPAFLSNPQITTVAQQMDGVVLVVNCQTTRSEVALTMKEQLEAANVKLIGVILNQRRYPIPDVVYRLL